MSRSSGTENLTTFHQIRLHKTGLIMKDKKAATQRVGEKGAEEYIVKKRRADKICPSAYKHFLVI
jgi:hypothetical protein